MTGPLLLSETVGGGYAGYTVMPLPPPELTHEAEVWLPLESVTVTVTLYVPEAL